MSNNYYRKIDINGKDITLTAFVGDDGGVQITIGRDYVNLTNTQVNELAMMLLARTSGNVTATGDEKVVVKPDCEYNRIGDEI